MSKRSEGKRPDPLETAPASDEEVDAYLDIGCRLAAQMAEENFRSTTADPDWTMDQVEAETELALGRMEITSRDMLAAKGSDPDGERWQRAWQAMERRYRERMDELLRETGLQGRGSVQ